MNESLENGDIEALRGLPLKELKRLWQERAGCQKYGFFQGNFQGNFRGRESPKVRVLLIRDLAWWVQQGHVRGLDKETQRLLKLAVRQTGQAAQSTGASEPQSQTPRNQKPPRPRSQKLQAGVTLVRKWQGKTYKVKVIEDSKGKKRYAFAGKEYRSLTVIAQEITGAHWSGPRFFGLNPRK